MRIVIDLTALSFHKTGIERYACSMARALLDRDKKNEYLLLFRGGADPAFSGKIDGKRVKAQILSARGSKLWFLQITLPLALWRLRAERYLFFAFPGPLLFWRRGIYNTIHDLGAWDTAGAMTFLQRLYWRVSLRAAARAAEGVITVSEFSKGRLKALLGVPEEKILVAPPAVPAELLSAPSPAGGIAALRERYHLPERYIMTLSTLEPRKNLALLLEAFSAVEARVGYDLVLVGREGWKIRELLSRYAARRRVHLTGFVPDEEAALLYRSALCFVFPSAYEGFGLPPLEALALGAPVLSSDAASLPEVLGERAAYFRSGSAVQLQELLLSLEEKAPGLPRGLDGRQNREYSFASSAEKLLRWITP